MGKNRLGDEGIDHLSEALAINTALEHLDLFDVPFTNNGARFLERALRRNTITLKSLRLANTRVTVDHAEILIDAINNSVSMLSFRWVNLHRYTERGAGGTGQEGEGAHHRARKAQGKAVQVDIIRLTLG